MHLNLTAIDYHVCMLYVKKQLYHFGNNSFYVPQEKVTKLVMSLKLMSAEGSTQFEFTNLDMQNIFHYILDKLFLTTIIMWQNNQRYFFIYIQNLLKILCAP